MRSRASIVGFAVAGVLAAGVATAQTVSLPNVSQKAVVGQTIGLTDVTVVYHRPLVNGRKVWGDLVPYGQVWRAGANDNTTISFEHGVTVEGKPLAAGTYGLHMIPGESEWTVIFSKSSTSWGSFSYDEKEDALRVTVKPRPAEFREALAYEIDDVEPDSAVVALEWEKLRVPFTVGVNVQEVVLATFRNELRSLPGFTWEGYNTAAAYCEQNGLNLEEALGWTDRSIQFEERFENLMTKSRLLAKLGRAAEAEQAKARAIEKGGAPQLHFYARRLLGEGKTQEALAVFKTNAERNPDSYIVKAGLARGYAATGDFTAAVASMKEALDQAPEPQKAGIKTLVERLERKENINN